MSVALPVRVHDEIVASVRKRYPDTDEDPVTILGHVREMKDGF